MDRMFLKSISIRIGWKMHSYSSTTRCLCVFTLLVLSTLGFSGCTAGDAPGKAADRRSDRSKEIQVTAVPVEAKEFRRNVEAVGSLFPEEEVTVSSEVDGKVDQ